MVQLASVYGEIQEAGAELWAISPQPVAQNEALRQRYSLPFPILADADQTIISEWGLLNKSDPKKRPIPYPATYLVGRNGQILWAHLGITTRDRPTPGQIVAALRELGD